ncbi:MAG: CCA tRNA nucleotidyltransferase [Verrucomicrobiota bacterium]
MSLYAGAESIVRKLNEAGFTTYFAGGSVRDQLLDRKSKDIDIATSATPEEVQSLFPRTTDLQGKVFGVIRVIENDLVYEVATFRKDGAYQDGRRPTEVEFSNPEEDANRRDFTINGLFYDPVEKKVIDFVGGQDDLKTKTLRAIGDPEARFREDHLRLYRAIRFAAEFDFEIEELTWKKICDLSHLGGDLAPERVRDEMIKSLTGSNPLRAFDLLDRSGLFAPWIPEIAEMKGVEQPPQFHPEGDVFVHVRMMVGMLNNPDPVLALSVLLHDISKPETYSVDPDGRIRFTGHETKGARKSEDILRRLKCSNELIESVSACVANHMAFKDVPDMRVSTLKRFMARPWIETELELHRIDCTCSHGDLEIYDFLLEKIEEFSNQEIKPDPFVNGRDLISMGMKPGQEIGKVLTQLYDEQLEGKFLSRDIALQRANSLVQATYGPAA